MRFVKFTHSHTTGTIEPESNARSQLIRSYTKIGGEASSMSYSGVFLSGPRPCFVMVGGDCQDPLDQFDAVDSDEAGFGSGLLENPGVRSGTGYLRVHPFGRDGGLLAINEFCNEVSPNGFLYLNDKVCVGSGLMVGTITGVWIVAPVFI
jgi:hypothetical protein